MWALDAVVPYWVSAWVLLNIGTWVFLLIRKYRQRWHNDYRLHFRPHFRKALYALTNFPQSYPRLLAILLRSKAFRLESIWKRFTALDRERLLRSNIPNRLRHMCERGPKWRRVRALQLLGRLRDPQAVGVMRRLVFHQDADVAQAAITALARYLDENHARFLVSLLSSRYHIRGSRVASVIEGLPLNLSEFLLSLLKLSDATGRFWAATLLGRYPTDEVRQTLLNQLKTADDDPNLRAAVLDSLGKIGNASCTEGIATALQDPTWYVRAHAALACGQAQLFGAVPNLIVALTDPVWWVRSDASRALEMLLRNDRSRATSRQLLAAMGTKDPFARDSIAALLANNTAVHRIKRRVWEAQLGAA